MANLGKFLIVGHPYAILIIAVRLKRIKSNITFKITNNYNYITVTILHTSNNNLLDPIHSPKCLSSVIIASVQGRYIWYQSQ